MDAQEIWGMLDKVMANTVVKDWYDIVPLGHPNYWQMPSFLRTFASLSLYWQKVETGWLRLSTEMVNYEIAYGYPWHGG